MKKSGAYCQFALFATLSAAAQFAESLRGLSPVSPAKGDFARHVDRRSSTKGYRMAFIAAPLIVGAAVRDLGVVPA